jgi:hypothetical protein
MKKLSHHLLINTTWKKLITKSILIIFLFLPIHQIRASSNIESYLCHDRDNCKILEIHQAGNSMNGEKMKVIKLKVPKNKTEIKEEYKETIPYEYWLVTSIDDKPSKQLIMRLFNTGYGIAGVGEDKVIISDNLLVHEQSGGSYWRWKHTTKLKLSPLTLLSADKFTYWTYSSNVERSEWNWERFSGHSKWHAPFCKDQNFEEVVADLSKAKYEFTYIPQIDLPKNYLDTEWKNTKLDTCSTNLPDRKNTKNESLVKIIASGDDSIFIEVDESDNKTDYKIDLYLNFEHNSYFSNHCLDPKEIKENLEHYQISGKKKKLSTIKKSKAKKVKLSHSQIKEGNHDFTIYKISIPPRSDLKTNYNLTIFYQSKTDHFANSDITNFENLGSTYNIKKHEAECKIDKGKLVKEIFPHISSDQAILNRF